MKKVIIAAIFVIGTAVTMANTGGKKKKSTSPPKGTVVINTKDSTVTARHSDSTLAAGMIPTGFKLVEKPR